MSPFAVRGSSCILLVIMDVRTQTLLSVRRALSNQMRIALHEQEQHGRTGQTLAADTYVISFNPPLHPTLPPLLSQLEKQAQQKWWHRDVTLVLIPEPGHLTTVLNVSTKGNP